MTPDEQMRQAINLVRAMMGSASSEKIRRIEWWLRAKSALETAAMSSDSFGSMVSTMGRKLQIDVTTIATGEQVAQVGLAVAGEFETWRRFCATEALYVVAIAQAESKERKELWQAEQEGMAESARQLDKFTEATVNAIPAKD
jgi:hypothetical protein